MVAFGACLLLAGCAQTGPPLPPSLELPKPPSDLRATRKGDVVTLTWSEPMLTTDRQSVRYLGPTVICRSHEPEMTTCGAPVEVVSPPVAAVQQEHGKKAGVRMPVQQTFSDTLSARAQSDDPSAELTYAVEILNRNARGAGLSNRVHVPAIATLPAPADLAATLTGDGVVLNWTSSGEPPAKSGVQYRYRIFRHTENSTDESGAKNKSAATIAAEVPMGQSGAAHFLDSIEWEKTYEYRITAVSIINRPGREVQVEGNDSPAVRVVAHDVFSPSVPSGLQAVYSGEGQRPFIDLIWAPVTNSDLAGYHVYRREGDSPAEKLNVDPLKTPSYRDTAVHSGKTYTYSVSAVDVRGNESARSDEASESVP